MHTQQVMSLYTAAHYKNQPNDLQLLSDAPAHHLFVLLGPNAEKQGELGEVPDVLCVVQVFADNLQCAYTFRYL